MQKYIFVFLLAAAVARAEVHSLTLREALEIASRQNPDIALAHLDQQRTEQGIKVAKDPFRPKVYGGSGLAYTYGYPNSIDGNAPSIFEVKTDMALYNRPDSFLLAEAKESARGASLGAQAKADDVAYQTASLFLDARQAENVAETISAEIPDLRKVVDVTSSQVAEGVQLPLELMQANVNLEAAQQRVDNARLDADYLEMMLAVTLGYPVTDRVHPIESKLPDVPEQPVSEDEATRVALNNNKELREMRSNVLAKELELHSYRSERLPQVNLVAQYALFAKYNYAQYFQKFQSNNFQIGASITIPLLVGSSFSGRADQAATDMQKIRIQMEQLRNRVTTDTRHSYQEWKRAQESLHLTHSQLDLAREQLTVLLAQNAEGKVTMGALEQARVAESNDWIALYEAQNTVLRAQLAILRQMGTLMAAVRGVPMEASPKP
ncbi:MAG TPA: TolC family protein [Bryobacteraceae bacterium]|nr:TolC family protein [Bryobacteraceae bacterium]